MPARHIIPLGLVALACGTATLRAQDTTAARSQNIVGFVARATQGDGLAQGLQLGREWRAPGSRLALQLTASYTGLTVDEHPVGYALYPGSIGTESRRSRHLALNFGTSYSLTRGRLQPYLLGGLTLQRSWARTRFDAATTMPQGLESLSFPSYSTSVTETSLGVQGGAGLSLRVRGVNLFTELRATTPLVGHGWITTRAPSLTFGLRF